MAIATLCVLCGADPPGSLYTDKKEKKILLIREFRRERLQRGRAPNIWGNAHIFSHIWLQPLPSEFPYMRKIFFSFLSVYIVRALNSEARGPIYCPSYSIFPRPFLLRLIKRACTSTTVSPLLSYLFAPPPLSVFDAATYRCWAFRKRNIWVQWINVSISHWCINRR